MKCIDDEIPFEIPEGWEWCRLGFLSEIIGGYAFESSSLKASSGERVIRISDINETGFVNNKIVRYNGTPIPETYRIKKLDILMAMTGGTVGKSLYVKTLPEDSLLLNQRVAIIRNRFIDSDYLDLVIKSPHVKDVINSRKNSTNDNISMTDIYNFLIPIPAVQHQVVIVKVFSDILPLINRYGVAQFELDRLNTNIKATIQKSVLQEAIQGKLVPQDPNDEPASVLLERIHEEKLRLLKEGKLKKKDITDSVIFKGEDNKYFEKKGNEVICIDDELPFEIPESWMWTRLGNCCTLIGGYAFKSHEIKSPHGHRVIRISDISDEGLVDNNIVRYNGSLDLSKYQIIDNDILIAMTGGTVGKSMLYARCTDDVLLLNQRVAIIRSKLISPQYIYAFIRSPYIKEIIDNAKNSTNDNISMADISSFLIPLPPLNEQKRIVEALDNVVASIMRN